jgi:hypothetical protein
VEVLGEDLLPEVLPPQEDLLQAVLARYRKKMNQMIRILVALHLRYLGMVSWYTASSLRAPAASLPQGITVTVTASEFLLKPCHCYYSGCYIWFIMGREFSNIWTSRSPSAAS